MVRSRKEVAEEVKENLFAIKTWFYDTYPTLRIQTIVETSPEMLSVRWGGDILDRHFNELGKFRGVFTDKMRNDPMYDNALDDMVERTQNLIKEILCPEPT